MFKTLSFSLRCAACLLGATSVFGNTDNPAPKKIILMIGDGMGPAMTTAFRHYADDPKTSGLDATLLDQLWVGKVKTHPLIEHSAVTDSAAGATALATGHKTHNFMLSQTPKQQALPNWFDVAKAQNMRAAVVVTSQIAHATPAAFLSHHSDRFEYQAISDKIFAKPSADLILGGGNHYFSSQAEQRLRQAGYQITRNYAELEQLQKLPALGVFGKYALQPSLESNDPNRLTSMTRKALQLLQNSSNGFVLMIEGSQIDWAAHENDIVNAMHEMSDFVSAVALVHAYVQQQPHALMVITADHGTGGLSMGAHVPSKGHYRWYPEVLRNIKESPKTIAKRCFERPKAKQIVCAEQALHYPLSPEEIKALQSATQVQDLQQAIKTSINTHSNTGWTTTGHTGEDVDIYAFGRRSQDFAGLHDNTEIGQKLIDLVKSP